MNRSMWGWVIGVAVVIIILGFAFRWWQGYIAGPAGGGETAATSATSTALLSGAGAPVSVAPKSGNSVAAIVEALPDASRFQALFEQSGVMRSLKGRGPYTVFVPLDSAFNNLPQGSLAHLTAAEEKRLVQYHIVKGRALDVDAVSSGTIDALSGDALNFHADVNHKSAQVNSGWVLRQYKGKNGVVYTISLVLLPPTKTQ